MFLSGLKPDRPVRVPGTALFMTADVDKVPAALLHNLKHNKVLHERVVLMQHQDRRHPAGARRSAPRDPPPRA